MRKFTLLFFVTTFFLGAIPGQTTADYSGIFSDCPQLQQDIQNKTDADFNKDGTHDLFQHRVDNLCSSLGAGDMAETWAIDDVLILNLANALSDFTWILSINNLIEDHNLRNDAEALAIAAREQAEVGVALSEPFSLDLKKHRVHLTRSLLDESQSCVVVIQAVHTNPDAPGRWSKFNVTATAAPAGGTYRWAFLKLHTSRGEAWKIEDDATAVLENTQQGFGAINGQISGEGSWSAGAAATDRARSGPGRWGTPRTG